MFRKLNFQTYTVLILLACICRIFALWKTLRRNTRGPVIWSVFLITGAQGAEPEKFTLLKIHMI